MRKRPRARSKASHLDGSAVESGDGGAVEDGDGSAAANAALRARLEEVEQTLEAIRSGKVDALIVSDPAGERVFTLQGADHRYRRIVEGMTEGAAIVNSRGVILYANAAFSGLVASPLDRVLGSQVRQYVPEDASASFDRLIREAGAPGARAEETTLLRSADRIVPVHVSAAADGELEQGGICIVVTDLSDAMRDAERRRSQLSAQLESAVREQEAQRGESEAQFRQLVDNLPELAWHALPNGYVDFYNRRWYEYTGTTFEQMQGWGWQSVHRPDLLEAVTERWRRSIETGEPFEMEYPLRGADGVYRWFLSRVRPLRDAEGRVVRFFGTNTDIDERKRAADAIKGAAEAERRARDRAEEATRLKDEFLATLSHELRTPLNAILGWGRMLQSEATPPERRGHALDAIVRNARAQNQLIEDLLDVSRIMSGKLRLSVGLVDVAQIIEAAIDVVQPAADAKRVQVRRWLEPDAGLVSGDAGRLQQVVWNLLSNAVKFTPRGGRVDVALRRVGSSVTVSVSDTGTGITPDFLPHVFDRFRQEDGAITRKAGGLGLGLAIVKNIVELHGGAVEAQSRGADQGSTFTVKIPIAPSSASSQCPASVAPESRGRSPRVALPMTCPPELSGLKVLVVDDEADARDLIRTVLEHCAVVVTTAATAAEAMDVIPALRPEVIVSDIGLPDADGYAFIRSLRQRPREAGGRTPAVALTAYARPEDRRRALLDGFQSYAAKPIDPQELVIVIANLVGRVS